MDNTKHRYANISLSPALHLLGQKLAEEDHRDFSNQVEWLIEEEWKRRGRVPRKNGKLKVAA